MEKNSYIYRKKLFKKIGVDFKKGKKILDVGCGNGKDAEFFVNVFGLDFYGVDKFKGEYIKKNFKFKTGSIYKIPYNDNIFDYVYINNVLHHIDESKQSEKNHLNALLELKRVCKKGGYVIIVEANRYNPIFYPHMVLLEKHDHFKQNYFRKIIGNAFTNDKWTIKFAEAHIYPKLFLPLFNIYEFIMERFCPKNFLAYNIAIVKKNNM